MNTTAKEIQANKAKFKVDHKELLTSLGPVKSKFAKALCNHPIVDQVLTMPKGMYCLADSTGFTGTFDEAYRNLLTASQEGYRMPVKPAKLQSMELELLNDFDSISKFFEKESSEGFALGVATQHLGLDNPLVAYRPQGLSDPSTGLLRAQSFIMVARIDGNVVGLAQLEIELDEHVEIINELEDFPETDKMVLPYSMYMYIANLVVTDAFKKTGVAETLVVGAVQAFANYVEQAVANPTDQYLVLEATIQTDAHTKKGQKCSFLLEELLEAYMDELDETDVIDTEKSTLVVPFFN